jgi:hypothetical protein
MTITGKRIVAVGHSQPSGWSVEAEPGFALGVEPEDAILIESGILPILIQRARQEHPSADWLTELIAIGTVRRG